MLLYCTAPAIVTSWLTHDTVLLHVAMEYTTSVSIATVSGVGRGDLTFSNQGLVIAIYLCTLDTFPSITYSIYGMQSRMDVMMIKSLVKLIKCH